MIKLFGIILVISCAIPVMSQALPADTTAYPEYGTQGMSADTTGYMSADSLLVTRKVIKRDYVHKEQLIQGTWMMVFIILTIVTSKNWNPK